MFWLAPNLSLPELVLVRACVIGMGGVALMADAPSATIWVVIFFYEVRYIFY
jgi:hypothetical protein